MKRKTTWGPLTVSWMVSDEPLVPDGEAAVSGPDALPADPAVQFFNLIKLQSQRSS